MSGGASIPYHLRSSKMADRSLFVELLRRLERWRRLDNHVYASMGGYPMADHHRVHRVLGLRRLLCFDKDEVTVRRQLFNRPTKECACVSMTSRDFVDDPAAAYRRSGIRDWAGQIVWLDYTSPSEIGSQIDEFVALLSNSQHGDVIRITLNANEKALKGGKEGLSITQKTAARFQWFSEQVAQYLPADASQSDLTPPGYARLLARVLRAAAADALGDGIVVPLSIVRYNDSAHQMLAATLLVHAPTDGELPFERSMLADWSLLSRSWTEIHPLRVTALTSRERSLLDRLLPAVGAEKLVNDLPFSPLGEDISRSDTVEHLNRYRDLLRFYPDLLVLE